MSGNSGTNPTNDYIGTSDNTDLVFRTNASEAMRIDNSGNVGINDNNPSNTLEVNGSFLLNGDFVNQQALKAYNAAVQNVPYNNGIYTPLTGTTVGITITDGNGVNNSAVFVSGFARIFGGSLDGANSSVGGYFLILQRDTNPTFPTPVIVTYTGGICYLETPSSPSSSRLGFGDGPHISYLDDALTAGQTYYYRLVLYANGVGITSGTYDVYQRSLTVLQIKR